MDQPIKIKEAVIGAKYSHINRILDIGEDNLKAVADMFEDTCVTGWSMYRIENGVAYRVDPRDMFDTSQ